MSHIDEQTELEKYRDEVLSRAKETMSEEDVAYVEENLRSPCKQEIAVFRAFAEMYAAMRLEEDLKRANIAAKLWVINSSLYWSGTTNKMLSA